MPLVQVFTPTDLRKDTPPDLNAFYPRLLAEGDSWFSVGSHKAQNLIRNLHFERHACVVSLAYPGDTGADVAAALPKSHRRMDLWMSEFGGFVADPSSEEYHAILLSAGGNDLIDALPALLKTGVNYAAVDPGQPQALVDAAALAQFDQFLIRNIRRIVAFVRDSAGPSRDAPIVMHTYDYATPNNAAAQMGPVQVGPWMYPHLVARGIPTALWIPLSDYLLKHLADTLTGVMAPDLPEFHVVRTLGTVTRAALGATGESGDWENEIHLTAGGYRKVANKVAAKIVEELGL
jgi:lysophospholipase L1-like esterase